LFLPTTYHKNAPLSSQLLSTTHAIIEAATL
jgi:hypothetical protein